MTNVFRDEVEVKKSPEEEYVALLAEQERRLKYLKFHEYTPYPKQLEWLGFMCKVKALFGANRVGKTLTAAFEVTCHLTGLYPEWWAGKKFFRPVQVRCIAVSFEQLRKVMQTELLGDINYAFGSGMVPKDLIIDKSMRQGVPDTVDTFWVRHVPTGGISVCELMSNVQGREAFQGDAKQVVWIDEECDWDVFLENKMRTAGTGDKASGIILVTFTPLKGWTQLVRWLLEETDHEVVKNITIGWDDVPHLSKKEKYELGLGLLPHEMEARSKGIPTQATGLVYPIDPKELFVSPFEFESYDKGLIGLDVAPVGITAAGLLMEDYHARMTYLVAEHYSEAVSTATHAMGIRARFGRFPIRIDPSSQRRGSLDSDNLIKEYKECFGDRWEIKNAYNGVYSGISRLWSAMQEGRFRVFSNCRNFQREWANYLWDENKKTTEGHPMPRKKDDHLCLAGSEEVLVYGKGWVPIASIVGTDGVIWTPFGWCPYQDCRETDHSAEVLCVSTRDGRVLRATKDHPVLTRSGFTALDELRYASDIVVGGVYDGSSGANSQETNIQWPQLLPLWEILQQTDEPGSAIPAPCCLGEFQRRYPGWDGYPSFGRRYLTQLVGKSGGHAGGRPHITAYDGRTQEVGEGEHQEDYAEGADLAFLTTRVCLAQKTRKGDMGRGCVQDVDLLGMRSGIPDKSPGYEEQILRTELQNEGVPAQTPGVPFKVQKINHIKPAGRAPVFNLTVPIVGCFYTRNGFIVSNCDAVRYAYWGVAVEKAALPKDYQEKAFVDTYAPLDPETGY